MSGKNKTKTEEFKTIIFSQIKPYSHETSDRSFFDGLEWDGMGADGRDRAGVFE